MLHSVQQFFLIAAKMGEIRLKLCTLYNILSRKRLESPILLYKIHHSRRNASK